MPQELSIDDIRHLTKVQEDIESEARTLRAEFQDREKAENNRHNVAIGEIKRWYNQKNAELNARIKDLNDSSKGLMPIRPRR